VFWLLGWFFRNMQPLLFQPANSGGEVQVFGEIDESGDLFYVIQADVEARGKNRGKAVVTGSEEPAALVVGDAGGAVEHEVDQRFGPLGVSPVVGFSLDVLEADAGAQGEKADVGKGRIGRIAGVLGLGQGAHGRVVGIDASVDEAVHGREIGGGGAGVKGGFGGGAAAIGGWAGEVVEELGLPGAGDGVFVVQVKCRDEDAFLKAGQGGFAEEAVEFGGQGLGAVVGAGDFAQVLKVVEPGVVKHDGAFFCVEVLEL